MNPVAKLAGFAAVLVLAFGGAAFAGSRIDVRPGKQSPGQPEAHGMGAADAEREGGHGRGRRGPTGGARPRRQRRRPDAQAHAQHGDGG